jgi:uncharacterized repeat protein (TIGR02543 family)
MPWGVAGIEGTIWHIIIGTQTITVSTADGLVTVTSNSGYSVQVKAGLQTSITSPIAAPTMPITMTSPELGNWQAELTWLQGVANNIQNQINPNSTTVATAIMNALNSILSGPAPAPISTPSPGGGGGGGGGGSVSPQTYTITYNGNGATGGTVPPSSTYASGVTVTVPGNTGGLTKTGYVFDGWNTAANGSGTAYQPGNTLTMGSANVTLYAVWAVIVITTTSLPSAAPGVSYSVYATASGGTPPYHWSASGLPGGLGIDSVTGEVYGAPAAGVSGSFSVTLTVVDSGAPPHSASITLNLTINKTAAPQTYTVTYNGNGATGGTSPTGGAYTQGAMVTVLGNLGSLVKTGYVFAGWNTAANGSGTTYQPNSTFTMGAANVTLYAVWSNSTLVLTTLALGGTIPALTVGGSAFSLSTLILTGLDQYGNSFSLAGLTATWAVASGSSYATVSGSTLTPVANGSGSVTATIDGVISNAVDFTVNSAAPGLASLNLSGSPNPSLAYVGQSLTYALSGLTLTGADQFGNPYTITDSSVAWSVVSSPATVSGSNLTITNSGMVTVNAAIGTLTSNNLDFMVSGPTLTVTPPGQEGGGAVTLNASGFAPGERMYFYMDDNQINGLNIYWADSNGKSSCSYTFGDNLTGVHTFKATGDSSGLTATVSYTVPNMTPTLTVTPPGQEGGGAVTLNASGFAPGERMYFYMDDNQINGLNIYLADSTGNSSCSYTFGDNLTGVHTFKATGDSSGLTASASYSVTMSGVALAITSGTATAGSQITLTATGFAPNERMYFYMDDNQINGLNIYWADGNGNSSVTYTLPAGNNPPYYFKAVGQYSNLNAVLLTGAASSQIVFDPSSYSLLPGELLTGTATGFTAGETVDLFFNNAMIASGAAAGGSFAIDWAVPDNYIAGSYTLTAVGTTSLLWNSANVTILALSPSVAAPATVTQGGDLQLQITGFAPGETVHVYVDNAEITGSPAVADSSGALTLSYSVPVNANSGAYNVTATGVASGLTAQTSFTVNVVATSVAPIPDITVPYGTSLASAGLPGTVGVNLSDGIETDLPVTWSGGAPVYDGNTAGAYAFTGTLTLASGITNPNNVTAAVSVIVAAT